MAENTEAVQKWQQEMRAWAAERTKLEANRPMMGNLYGWVSGEESDRAELESLGLVLGPHHPSGVFMDCLADPLSISFLEPLVGRFHWSMGPTRDPFQRVPDVGAIRGRYEASLAWNASERARYAREKEEADKMAAEEAAAPKADQ